MCGSVNYEAKVTYKLLSSYKLVCIQTKQSVVSTARHGFKVFKLNRIIFVSFDNYFFIISLSQFSKDLESKNFDQIERFVIREIPEVFMYLNAIRNTVIEWKGKNENKIQTSITDYFS